MSTTTACVLFLFSYMYMMAVLNRKSGSTETANARALVFGQCNWLEEDDTQQRSLNDLMFATLQLHGKRLPPQSHQKSHQNNFKHYIKIICWILALSVVKLNF